MSNVHLWTIDMDKHVFYETLGYPIFPDGEAKTLILGLIDKWRDANVVEHLGESKDNRRIFHLEKNGEHLLISSCLTKDGGANAVLFIKTESPEHAEQWFLEMKSKYLKMMHPVRH